MAESLRVARVVLRELRMHMRAPFTTSFGTVQDRRVTLVEVIGDGLSGWAECVAEEWPGYSEETADTAWAMIEHVLVPLLTGRTFTDPTGVDACFAKVRGNPMARAGIEAAAWDWFARARGEPLWRTLGGDGQPVPVGISVGLRDSVAELRDVVGAYVAEGYRRVKLKIEPGRDLALCEAIRTDHPHVPLTVDANSAYTLADAAHLAGLDAFGLGYAEQPLPHDDVLDHAALATQLATPICLDESVRHARGLAQAIDVGACEVLNLKLGRVGGLAESKRVCDVAVAAGVPVWCGGMLESGVGRAHNVALATLPAFTLPGDTAPSGRYWDEDIVEPEWTMHDGHVTPRDGPGVGVELRHDLIDRLTVRTVTLAP